MEQSFCMRKFHYSPRPRVMNSQESNATFFLSPFCVSNGPQCRCFTDSIPTPSTAPTLPSLSTLKDTAASFKESLQTSEEKIREIERETRSQRDSPLWYSVRRYRITAFHFGAVLRRQDDTPPDHLVLTIFQQKQFSSVAMKSTKVQTLGGI